MDQGINGSSSKSAWVYANLNKYEQESVERMKGGGRKNLRDHGSWYGYGLKIIFKTGKLLLNVYM